MPYTPNLKMYYYGSGQVPDDSNRFIPVPLISIEPELLYANDTVIGYNYNVSLQGYAPALNLNTYIGGNLNFTDTLIAVTGIRNIFDDNGKTLLVRDETGDVIVASGGLLQSLTFEQTENNWLNYATYNAQLSFDSLYLANCDSITTLGCLTLPSGIDTINSSYLADMRKYKIKSVQDGWTIDASNIYNSNDDLSLQNEYLDISYDIQAVGRHFIVNNEIIPAWQQAKNYCINRLHQEITRLSGLALGKVTSINPDNTCVISTSASGLSSDELQGLFYQLPSGQYQIYNENIQCSTSESEGSFSLNYSSLLKKISSNNPLFLDTHCIHRINTSRSVSDDGAQKIVTETIQGEIEGLIRGGLINDFETLKIPNDGFIIGTGSTTGTKYSNALSAYNKIIDTDPNIGKQLKSTLVVDLLNITNSGLNPFAPNPAGKPKKISHNIVHNFNNGTISYTEEYSSQNLVLDSGNSINNISMSISDNTNVIAEFIVPGRAAGPIIQTFAGKTPKTLNISIDGTYNMTDFCTILSSPNFSLPSGVPVTGLQNYEITEDRYSLNTNDGSYAINRSYIYIG